MNPPLWKCRRRIAVTAQRSHAEEQSDEASPCARQFQQPSSAFAFCLCLCLLPLPLAFAFASAFVLLPLPLPVTVAFRCHPEPIRAKRGWVRDLLLLFFPLPSFFCLLFSLPVILRSAATKDPSSCPNSSSHQSDAASVAEGRFNHLTHKLPQAGAMEKFGKPPWCRVILSPQFIRRLWRFHPANV